MGSPWRWRLFTECRPSRRCRSSFGSRRKPFTILVASRWVYCKQPASATKFGEQVCITHSRSGRLVSLVIKSTRIALEEASVQWIEGGKELSMRTTRCWTTFATCMESPGLRVAKDNWSGGALPIAIYLHLVRLIGRSQFTDQFQTL